MRAHAFYAFLREREATRLRKEAGSPFPWTDDPIIREFKFTNVRREHDRTTRQLRVIYEREGSKGTGAACLWNAATYRYFGTVDMAKAVGWQYKFNADAVISAAESVRAAGDKVFTGAYMITMNGKTGKKHEYVAREILAPLAAGAARTAQVAADSRSWEYVAKEMSTYEGFGGTGFMTKEVLLDTMFCPAFWPNGCTDKDTWTPVGPGARRGLNRVLGRDLNASMKPEEMQASIRELRRIGQESLWPAEHGPLSMHDVQFQLCEFDKYERARLGEGRPKAKYKPTE